jgi:hypothetical protein
VKLPLTSLHTSCSISNFVTVPLPGNSEHNIFICSKVRRPWRYTQWTKISQYSKSMRILSSLELFAQFFLGELAFVWGRGIQMSSCHFWIQTPSQKGTLNRALYHRDAADLLQRNRMSSCVDNCRVICHCSRTNPVVYNMLVPSLRTLYNNSSSTRSTAI